MLVLCVDCARQISYINTPKLFDGIECDDLLQEIVPVVTLI